MQDSKVEFKSQQAGRATFKIKQDHTNSPEGKPPATAEKEKKANASRMLTNDEIKEICERNTLSRGEVYAIRTQFASMCMMSEQW